jgi:hypothetical protein
MKLATVILLLLFLMLAACTGILATTSAPQQDETPNREANPSIAPSMAPGEQQPGLDPGVVILLTRSGGFSGKTEQWIIYADGRITHNSGEVANVTPAQIAALLQTIDQLGFYSLQGSYMPQNTCCDRFTYELTVTNDGKTNKVTFLEGTPDLPTGLWQATDAVNQLITAGTK